MKLRDHVLSRAFNEMAIGKYEERHDGFDPGAARADAGGYVIEDIVAGAENGTLDGHLYLPASGKAKSPGQKAVIFFSGSAGTNASQIGEAAAAYTSLGAAVVGIDYRGFGRSFPALDGKKITENSIYFDAWSIYAYVNVNLAFPPENIIIHGFSLGGACAAWLALRLAEERIHVGGLVLHSSIATMTEAAAGTLPLPGFLALPAGWAGGLLTGGAYDTRLYLERLSQLYPEIPLHLRSGAASSGDELGLDVTRLDAIGNFTRRTIFIGNDPHQISPGKKAGNMKGGLSFLADLL